MVKITAFTESGKTFEKPLTIRQAVSFGWPCEYHLDAHFINSLRDSEERRLCIDAGGRNHGVHESVYISRDEVFEFLKSAGIVL